MASLEPNLNIWFDSTSLVWLLEYCINANTEGTIINIPIVEDWDGHPGGGDREVKVLGFAAIQLTGLDGSGANWDLSGRFIETIGVGSIDPSAPDFGLKGIALVE